MRGLTNQGRHKHVSDSMKQVHQTIDDWYLDDVVVAGGVRFIDRLLERPSLPPAIDESEN